MIFCFSGTGNSRYIARRIAEVLQDAVIDLNVKIKAKDYTPIQAGRNVIVVAPTYAWRIPRIVSEWFSRTELTGAERIWFVMDCGGEAAQARRIVKRAEPVIADVIACIQAEKPFPIPRNNLYDRFMSGPVNPIFYRFCVKARAFQADDSCIGCGKCVEKCPMNNIKLKDRKPVWGRECTHCMACICYCPKEAIEYGKKSVGKPRYHFEQLQ